MSLTLIIPIFAILLILISQFGGKITARSAFIWWIVFGFILFCSIFPHWLEPITAFLGIQLVSNFVLASLILFLFFYVIQQSSMFTQIYRKQRDLISMLAASEFVKKTGPKTSQKALVFFPCFNEQEHLNELIAKIRALEAKSQGQFQFCIINDGSTDDTANLLIQNAPGISTHHSANAGVSGVLSTALKIASLQGYEYVIQVDADGQHPVDYVPEFLKEAEMRQVDLLIGSRFVHGRGREQRESTTTLRSFGSLLISLFLKMFSIRDSITDPTSGFRVYSKGAQKVLSKNLPDEYPEPESIALLMVEGLRLSEVAVSMRSRASGVSSLAGLKGGVFMMKVASALIGLRLRTLFKL